MKELGTALSLKDQKLEDVLLNEKRTHRINRAKLVGREFQSVQFVLEGRVLATKGLLRYLDGNMNVLGSCPWPPRAAQKAVRSSPSKLEERCAKMFTRDPESNTLRRSCTLVPFGRSGCSLLFSDQQLGQT